MNFLLTILKEIWEVILAMAPYLLFGFLMAGMLSVLIPKDSVRRHLGGHGLFSSVKAALFGVPLPICSCGVIPLAASLRKHGASRGATASFLASTPQTGIDSLMITYALLGWVYAVARAIIAFVSGILCGIAVSAVSNEEDEAVEPCTDVCCQPNKTHLLKRMFTYGFISLPRNIAPAILIGIAISGTLSALIPDNRLAQFGNSPYAMILMLIIGIPLYVCSSGSVPIALAFIKAGISPGAALIFLITGPATNAATLTTLWSIIGKKQLIIFLITLSGTALIAGYLMNLMDPVLGIGEQICRDHCENSILELGSAIVLLIILAIAMLPRKKRKQ